MDKREKLARELCELVLALPLRGREPNEEWILAQALLAELDRKEEPPTELSDDR
jgi:hypothetical protein